MMSDLSNKPRGFRRPVQDGDFIQSFLRILFIIMNIEMRPKNIRRLTCDYPPDIEVKLYEFVKAMICSWAGRDSDLSEEDGAVIEDCRKICDMMGWPPDRGQA